MAFVAPVEEILEERTATFGEQASYTHVFRLQYTHVPTVSEVQREVGIYKGYRHPDDPEAVCSNVQVRIASGLGGGGSLWNVTATYTTKDEDEEENPTDRKAQISYGHEVVELDAIDDYEGEPIVNKAGDAIIGGKLKEFYQSITVVRDELSFSRSRSKQFANTLNSSTWNGYGAQTVLCLPIDCSYEKSQWVDRKKLKFYTVTYNFLARVKSVGGEDLKVRFRPYNQGFRAKFPDPRGLDWILESDLKDGEPEIRVSEPQFLNDEGELLPTDETPQVLEFQMHGVSNFGELNISLD